MVAWRSPVLVGSCSESNIKSSDTDTVLVSGRTMAGAFFNSKPEALSSLGLMVSEEVAVRRVVDTHLACIHFSFLAASNVSDVLKKSDRS